MALKIVSRGRQCQKSERGVHYWSAFSGYGIDKFLTRGKGWVFGLSEFGIS